MKWLVRLVAMLWVVQAAASMIDFVAEGGFGAVGPRLEPGTIVPHAISSALLALIMAVGVWNRRWWAWWCTVLISGFVVLIVAVLLALHPVSVLAAMTHNRWVALKYLAVVFAFAVLLLDSILKWRADAEGFSLWGFATDPMHCSRHHWMLSVPEKPNGLGVKAES